MASNHDIQAAPYEHKRFLLQLSEKLNREDSKRIVYLEDLPKELEERAPWEVLAQLEVRGKTTTDKLIRILKDINRPDAAKKVKELMAKTRKAPLTRKDSGSSVLKLEDSLKLALKNCEVLCEQMDYLIRVVEIGGKIKIKELISEAKENCVKRVERKLKVASTLLSSTNQENEYGSVELASSSPTSSLESSLNLKSPELPVPQSPMRPRAGLMFNNRIHKFQDTIHAVTQTFRKKLSAVGISRRSDSNSSGDSSGKNYAPHLLIYFSILHADQLPLQMQLPYVYM